MLPARRKLLASLLAAGASDSDDPVQGLMAAARTRLGHTLSGEVALAICAVAAQCSHKDPHTGLKHPREALSGLSAPKLRAIMAEAASLLDPELIVIVDSEPIVATQLSMF